MDDHSVGLAEAVRVVATITGAYLRLRFLEVPQNEVDCAENASLIVTVR
jgi:hypothetical protein